MSSQGSSDLVDQNNSEVHEFEEDGEHIQMEINDGGAATAEFSSDPESENDSKEESEGSEHNVTMETDVDIGTEGEPWAEQNVNTSSQDENTQNQLLMIEREKRQSIEEKLENMSSTLEVMKDFFMNSGFMDKNKQDRDTTWPVWSFICLMTVKEMETSPWIITPQNTNVVWNTRT